MTIKILLHRWSRIQWILLDWTSIRSITRFIGASWNQADHVFFDVHVFTNIRQLGSQWWSLSIVLTNGTTIGVPTTGYWPYSGDSGLEGVTAPSWSWQFRLATEPGRGSEYSEPYGIPPAGAIIFFDNPSPTHNYSEPGYGLLG
ncbi:hypothetical protein B0H13DRAFT_611059 [Mycena leptocephala]|nr:hypothetical protein B0H13DRAFT_611059 [Mycena leptocephala]